MAIYHKILLAALLLAVFAGNNPAQDQDQLPANYVPSGGQIYKQYCAACHGTSAKGNGPMKRALRIPMPDLTTLAKRHGGKFPEEYVTGILRFGPGVASHGSGEMPTWGPLFDDYYSKTAAQRRIENLCNYLASLQMK